MQEKRSAENHCAIRLFGGYGEKSEEKNRYCLFFLRSFFEIAIDIVSAIVYNVITDTVSMFFDTERNRYDKRNA